MNRRSKSNHISIPIKDSIEHLHEHVACDEQVVKTLLADVKGANCRLTPALLLVDAHITFHPMVGWDVIIDTTYREGEITVVILVALEAGLTSTVAKVPLKLSEGPRGHCDEGSA